MKKRHRRRAALCLLLAAVLCVACVAAVDSRVRPLVQSYGQMSARRSAMLAVHGGVERVLGASSAAYRRFVTVERDDSGRVLSLETDVTAINQVKAAISNAVIEELSAREKQVIQLPLGSLLGGSFFTGRGPFLPITVHTGGTVIATLSDEFSDAGINQTKHSVYLDMQVLMTAALPLEKTSIELETRFLLCESVLVGDVPQTVLEVDLGGELSKIFGSGH